MAARWMVGRGVGETAFVWVLGAHCLSRKTWRNAGWWVGWQGRLLVGTPVGWVLRGWVLRGWWMSRLGTAGVAHPVLRFVLVVEVVQDYHFEVEGERSRRDLAVPLRLGMGLDAGGRWVAAAVRLMLWLGLVVETARKHRSEAEGEPSKRNLALELRCLEETDAAGC